VLELSLGEALSLGHNYIRTEHLLLALMRVDDGVAAQVLAEFGADRGEIRDEITRLISDPEARATSPTARREHRRFHVPPWIRGPQGVLPGVLALELVLARTDRVAIAISLLLAIRKGSRSSCA
jgi:hypothetical protein